MNETEDRKAAALRAYADEIATYTLTELEDVFSHLERRVHPDRVQLVRDEMDRRLRALDSYVRADEETGRKAGPFRRLWSAFVDVFITTGLPVGVYLLYRQMTAPATPPGAGRRGGRRGGGAQPGFLDRLMNGDVTLEELQPYLIGIGVFIAYRALVTIPQWVRRGETTGLREAGIRLVSEDGGAVRAGQAVARFLSFYLLFLPTLGLNVLWMFWDKQGRGLHDRIAGTRVDRIVRSWNKPQEARLLED